MPASITMALVAVRPNVAGRNRLIPASGPTPGSTPTRVPTTQPTNAYMSTGGESATAKPMPRFCSVSSIASEAARSDGQRHAQQRREQIIRAVGEAGAEEDGGDP